MRGGVATQGLGSLGASARATVRELLLSGPLSRAELARRLGLSPASLTKTARSLLDSGVVLQEQAGGVELRGRPGAPLQLNARQYQLVGVKVTADAVYGSRTDARGQVLQVSRRTLPATDVDTVVRVIVDMLKEIAHDHPVQAIGVGLAGTMQRFDDTVRRNEYLGWDDVPLARILSEETGLPTVLSRDARALTAGVQWAGPGRGHRDFAVMTVGVGIGLGLVVDDQVLAGERGNAGLIGHTRISDSGPLCALGHRGCATSFLTSDAVTRAVGVPHGRPDMTVREVCELAATGDEVAVRVVNDAGTALGTLVSDVVNILGSPVVIVTGDGLEVVEQGRAAMDAALTAHLDPSTVAPRVEIFRSDFDEWARGAAVVACQWLLGGPSRSSPDTN